MDQPPKGSSAAPASGYDRPQWHFVEDWPQVPGHLRDTLDARLISQHAEAVLRRALDFKRVIGFIGSGVSMSYGRLGWGELIRWLARPVKGGKILTFEDVEAIDALGLPRTHGHIDLTSLTPTQRLMKELLDDLQLDRPDGSPDIQSGRFPAAFQFLEQISRELESPEGSQPDGESRVRRMLRAMLRDDAGQAYLLIERMLEDLMGENAHWSDARCAALRSPRHLRARLALSRPWRSLHDYLERSARFDPEVWMAPGRANAGRSGGERQDDWRSFFAITRRGMEAYAQALPMGGLASRLCTALAASVWPDAVPSDRALVPLHRFVVPALVRLDPLLACRTLLATKFLGECDPLRARHLRIDAGRDPLLVLLRDFGIDRLATTNYDLDIEQTLVDLGFDADQASQGRRGDVATGLSRNALGVPAHDAVFTHEHAAVLLRFANARAAGIEVMHMHGRVLPGEPLVVTEGDYQAMYLQRTEVAEAAAEAIALTMRSNTVLFLGSGMSEDDILRPMRQFVTERRSGAPRSAVVLLPADGAPAREVEEVIALYSQYGVLTKHFGVGLRDGRRVRWLAYGIGVCRQVHDLMQAICDLPDLPASGWHAKALRAVRQRRWSDALKEDQWPSHINGRSSDELVHALRLGDSFAGAAEIAMLRTLVDNTTELRKLIKGLARSNGESDERHALRRTALCLKALSGGIEGALRALAMMLELAGLHHGWQAWKHDRTIPPLARPVGAQRRKLGDQPADGQAMFVFTRNRLALRPLGDATSDVPVTDRFRQNAPSHSFSRFVAALRTSSPQSPATWRLPAQVGARRIFVLLTRRGMGKGHFFEMMAEESRIAEFIDASWHRSDSDRRPPPAYAVACYVNLGVSLEFLSAFDRLSDALAEMAAKVFGSTGEGTEVVVRIQRAQSRLASNRLARLTAILGLYAEHSKLARARVLLAVNGFAQLFDRHGAAKNAQLHRLIQALLGPAAAQVPIDLLMICQDDELPGIFSQDGIRLPISRNVDLDGWSGTRCEPLAHVSGPMPEERLRRKVDEVLERVNLAPGGKMRYGSAWVHVLRGAQASATVGKYFPEVAIAVALGPTTLQPIIATPRAVRKFQDELARLFDKQKQLHQSQSSGSALPVAIDKATLAMLSELASTLIRARPSKPRLSDMWPGLEARVQRAVKASTEHAPAPEINDRFGLLHRAVRSNRFLLTIACAAASERGWLAAADGRSDRFDTAAVNHWLHGLRLEASNHLSVDAFDRIIGKVLQSFQEGHEQGRVPPFFDLAGPVAIANLQASLEQLRSVLPAGGRVAAPSSDTVPPAALYGPLAWRLQHRLLWHLAVTALEVQADVLATAPLVERDCTLIVAELLGLPACELKLHEMRRLGVCRHLVALMMDLLVHRCLVFRMEPVQLGPMVSKQQQTPPDPDKPPTHTGWRFAIHRFLQRTILEQLKSPIVEFPRVDQFGLSMWATQPDDLPSPGRSAAHDIADLVASWIGFPKNGSALRAVSTFHWHRQHALHAAQRLDDAADWNRCGDDWRTVTLPSRMLRAALGVLRATYSVGVVSHFHAFDDEGGRLDPPAEGYFKQHHLQVRWLLEQASRISRETELAALLRKVGEPAGGSGRPLHYWWGVMQEAIAPFFADELVWLNNECGLFCLVEGRLQNAAGMFRQALLAAERVEGRDRHGALWCRIGLNLAIVDIERGRIRDAVERLRVIEGVRDENPILRILARGFLALVQHLGGQLEQAAVVYRSVIDDLVALGQLRSVAIFSRHLAELHRVQGSGASDAAWRAVKQAISAAKSGGHEDIHHMALLSQVRLAIARVVPLELLQAERAAIQASLDRIENYGRAMGMPRLLAEVAFARSLFLLDIGDMRHASRLAYECLGLCGMNGLQLRRMMGTALLGRIYERRGMPRLAEPLLMQASAMAADFHYGNLREGPVAPVGLTALGR